MKFSSTSVCGKLYCMPLKVLLIMKLIAVFLIVGLLQVSAKGVAQKITLSKRNVPLEHVFKEIRKQSGYNVLTDAELLKGANTVNINIKDASLEKVLDECFAGQEIDYTISNKTIIVKRKDSGDASRQDNEIIVKGVVKDVEGPLQGVSVILKDSPKRGVVTDANGAYSITVPSNGTLVFSMVGYSKKEVPVMGEVKINVTLELDEGLLNEVTVVAFGTQKKSTMVGSVTTLNPKELKGPTSNLTTMMAGRVAGMIAYQRSGEPGRDNSEFFIRGISTFGTGKRDPLILINGIEMSPNDLARIQPDDIAGFSVLKDATAASLFGARGANGVVLVTTKSGAQGKTKFNARFENSISSNTQNLKLADNITYMKLANEAAVTRNPLAGTIYEQEKIERTAAGDNPLLYPSNDWMKLLIKDYTHNQRFNLNLSGGVERAQYYISGTFNEDNGILKSHSLNDFNSNVKARNYEMRANINVKLTPSTEAIVRTTGQFDDYNGPYGGGASVFTDALSSNPVMFPAIFSSDLMPHSEHPLFGNAFRSGTSLYNNPYANTLSGFQQTKNANLIFQLEMKQDLNFFTPGLSTRFMAYTRRNSFFSLQRQYSPFYYSSVVDPFEGTKGLKLLNEGGGTEYLTYSEGGKILNSYNYIEAAVNYDKIIAEKHTVNGMLIGLLSSYQTGNAGTLQNSLPQRNQSLSGRLTYNYDSRYLTEFNFGYNGSERFYKDFRFGFFPSVGVAWNITEEDFFSGLKSKINKLKLRASYGVVGNDQIGNINERFFYLSNVEMNSGARGYYFGDNFNEYRNGIAITRYDNKEITWEKAYKSNLALELMLFNSLNLEVELYKEHRKNILMPRVFIPATMGLAAQIQANVGEAEGKGLDMSLDYNKSFGNKTWLGLRGSFTYAASKLLVNEEPNYSDDQKLLSKVGRPISQFYGLIAERYFIDENEVLNSPRQNYGQYQAGDIKYRDVNGDGQITDLDKVPIGFPQTPEIIYGFGFSYGFKKFDISAYAQGAARSSFMLNPSAIAPFIQNGGRQNGLLTSIADSHWSEENRDLYAFYPRLTSQALNNNYQTSTWWMRNGSFLRLKTVEVGYTLPDAMLQKIKLSNFRVYVNGMNLFALSKFKMWDTEMGGNGLGYPVQRVFNLGVNVGF